MHCILTRAQKPTLRFELALLLALLPCCSVELVGVDRATILLADAAVGELDASGAIADAAASEARPPAMPPAPDASSTVDATAPVRWSDPSRPATLPGQFVDPAVACPAIEPVADGACNRDGQQCDYPVCWGGGQRSWVCVEQRFVLWFDESFLCAASRPCPRAAPRESAVCSLHIACLYPYFCCKGPEGFLAARCDGQWAVDEPICVACVDNSP